MLRLVNGELGVVYYKCHFVWKEMYTGVRVESRHGLSIIVFICFLSAQRVCPQVNPAYQEKDTNISNLKNQDLYGTEKS